MRVESSGFRDEVEGSGCRVEVEGSGFRLKLFGLRIPGLGFRTEGSGFRTEGLGFRVCRVQGLRLREAYGFSCFGAFSYTLQASGSSG